MSPLRSLPFVLLALLAFLLAGCQTPSAARPTDAPLSTAPAATDPLQARAEEIVALVAPNKEPAPDLFTEAMSNYRGQVVDLLRKAHASFGPATGLKRLEPAEATSSRFEVTLERDARFTLTVTIEPAPPHRVAGLWMTPIEANIVTAESLVARFRALPGRSSLLIERLDQPASAPLAAWNETEPLAIGSTFKLSVLAALDDEIQTGKRRWADTLSLEKRFRSQPSGILHAWPEGTPLTVQSLATLMISISDNTATDHLLFALGRERVEAALGGAPKANLPFLATAEAFRLKANEALATRWGGMSVAERRALLAGEVASLPFGTVGAAPSHIESIEWFYSASDLCRVMNDLRIRGPVVREILGVNAPLIEAGQFSWAGFKGGSEPGVINMTYVLEKKDGAVYGLSATWNDTKALDEHRFLGLVREALRLVADR